MFKMTIENEDFEVIIESEKDPITWIDLIDIYQQGLIVLLDKFKEIQLPEEVKENAD